MAVNYVKFQRGSLAAYQALLNAGRVDDNTLYFIYPEADASVGSLYMGERVISGGDIVLESAYLDDLKDVIVAGAETNSFLVRDGENWVAKSLDEVVNLIAGSMGANTEFDSNQFVADDLGVINLLGFAEAETNAQLTKGADGKVAWVKPDTSITDALNKTVQQLEEDLDALETAVGTEAAGDGIYGLLNEKANAADVYTKDEADKVITDAVAGAAHLKREIYESIELAEQAVATYGEAAAEYIYMVKKADSISGNYYDEYMAFKDENGFWQLERVGDWGVDLSSYAKISDVETWLNEKVDKVDGSRLITAEEAKKLEKLSIDEDGNVGISGTVSAANVQELYNAVVNITTGSGTAEYDGEQKTLLNIEPGAQVNVIDSVDETELVIDENKQLSIKQVAASKVIDLTTLLNAKADKDTVEALDTRVTAVEGMLTWVEMEEPTT